MNLRSQNLESLPNELPENLEVLDCGNNRLTSLPNELPNSIERLYCHYNRLTSLPNELPENLIELHCNHNELTRLPSLPESLERLECQYNKLTTLDNSNSSVPVLKNRLKYLKCDHNEFTSLPELPNSIKILDCQHNKLTSLPTLPENLALLYCYNNELTTLPDLPKSLNGLECHNNKLTSLPNLSHIRHLTISVYQLILLDTTELNKNRIEIINIKDEDGNEYYDDTKNSRCLEQLKILRNKFPKNPRPRQQHSFVFSSSPLVRVRTPLNILNINCKRFIEHIKMKNSLRVSKTGITFSKKNSDRLYIPNEPLTTIESFLKSKSGGKQTKKKRKRSIRKSKRRL